MPEQSLDDANIRALLKEVGGKAVAQRMQRHSLGDSGQSSCFMKETIELAGRHRPIFAMPWKQPALRQRLTDIMTFGPDRPPGPEQAKQILGKFDLAILLALALNNPDDHLLAVDIADLEPGHFASTHAGAIGKAEKNPDDCIDLQDEMLALARRTEKVEGESGEVQMACLLTTPQLNAFRAVIDYRKWQIARLLPKHYGDKLNVGADGVSGVVSINVDLGEQQGNPALDVTEAA